MISRRNFIKQTSMTAAAIAMTGLTQCRTNYAELRNRPVGGRVIDAHIHVTRKGDTKPCRLWMITPSGMGC